MRFEWMLASTFGLYVILKDADHYPAGIRHSLTMCTLLFSLFFDGGVYLQAILKVSRMANVFRITEATA